MTSSTAAGTTPQALAHNSLAAPQGSHPPSPPRGSSDLSDTLPPPSLQGSLAVVGLSSSTEGGSLAGWAGQWLAVGRAEPLLGLP